MSKLEKLEADLLVANARANVMANAWGVRDWVKKEVKAEVLRIEAEIGKLKEQGSWKRQMTKLEQLEKKVADAEAAYVKARAELKEYKEQASQ